MSRHSKAAVAFALGRIAFGIGLMAAPSRVASGWLGDAAGDPPTQVSVRGLGARDVTLAGGAALAALSDSGVRPWLVGCVACDAIDIVSTLAAGGALPARARFGTVALAGAAAAIGVALVARADS